MAKRDVFITGGTGYVGSRVIPLLIGRGHRVRALVRSGSEKRLPAGCEMIIGDPLRSETFSSEVRPADTFVQLVGVPHPSPSKGPQFRAVDLVSVRASVSAAAEAGVDHFIYLSVAHPAPVMKDYIAVRSEGERLVRESGMNASILRPRYVLGPGHRWPCLLVPVYKLMERIPATRDAARRLGLVSIGQMVAAIVDAVEATRQGTEIIDVPRIRSSRPASP